MTRLAFLRGRILVAGMVIEMAGEEPRPIVLTGMILLYSGLKQLCF